MAVYPQMRNLLEYSEHMGEGSTFVPALRDVRKSLDHIMTYFAIKYDFKEGDKNIQLDKTISNLEQATTILLDYVSETQKELLDELISGLSPEIVNQVCPIVYSDIYPKINALRVKIAKSGNPGLMSHFEECIKSVLDIGDLLASVEKSRPDLDRMERIHNQSSRKSHLIDIVKFTLVAIIGGLVVAIAIRFFP